MISTQEVVANHYQAYKAHFESQALRRKRKEASNLRGNGCFIIGERSASSAEKRKREGAKVNQTAHTLATEMEQFFLADQGKYREFGPAVAIVHKLDILGR